MNRENADALLDALTRTSRAITGSPKDIKELQALLKAEHLYNGNVDGDFGSKTALGMMEAFRQHPAMLNNAAPWLIRSMEEQGFGKQLRDLVQSNPDLQRHLVESALELVEKSPKAHSEQQAKLSLLNLYNYGGGIDGAKGREHLEAIKQLRAMDALQRTNLSQTPPASRSTTAAPESPSASPVVVKGVPGLIDPPQALVSQNMGSQSSFSTLSGMSQDALLTRLGGAIGQIDPNKNVLRDLFGRSVTDNAGRDVTIIGGTPVTPPERTAGLTRFIGRDHQREGLAILDLINRESYGGHYNLAAGEKPGDKKFNKRMAEVGDFTDMSVDDVIAWQKTHKKAVGRFQIVRGTMEELKRDLGLTGTEKFDVQMQDTMGLALLARRGYVRYLASDGSRGEERRIMRELSGEWAALPHPDTGVSTYHGFNGNHHLVTRGPVLEALHQERQAFQSYMANPSFAKTGQQQDFDDLMEVSDSITSRKAGMAAKPRQQSREIRSGAEDFLAPTKPPVTLALFMEAGDDMIGRDNSGDGTMSGGFVPQISLARRPGMGMAA